MSDNPVTDPVVETVVEVPAAPVKRTRAARVAPVETPVVADDERGQLRDFGGVQFYIKG